MFSVPVPGVIVSESQLVPTDPPSTCFSVMPSLPSVTSSAGSSVRPCALSSTWLQYGSQTPFGPHPWLEPSAMRRVAAALGALTRCTRVPWHALHSPAVQVMLPCMQ
jgi:hypothetical protein